MSVICRCILEWLRSWWAHDPAGVLRDVEKRILSQLKTPYRGYFVDIGSTVGSSDKIWTVSMKNEVEGVPVVLLHGLGGGAALWSLNLDALAEHWPVHAFDILGFGRSSRPLFSVDEEEVENQFVKSIEEWRKEMNIPRMVLLGHNMGGYIASAYTMRYPDRVANLILAEPWGFSEKPEDAQQKDPFWAQLLSLLFRPLNPLSVIRAVGPLGQWLVEKARPDLVKRFASLLGGDTSIIAQYICLCNSQTPMGEIAFQRLSRIDGWAKKPILPRLNFIPSEVPLTLIYGSRTRIDTLSLDDLKDRRGSSSINNFQVITGAGNHVYADKPDIFNRYVIDVCKHRDTKNK